MFEIYRLEEELISDEEGSQLAVAENFSELREKECDDYLSNAVKISFNFVLIFLEEVAMKYLRKELLRSSAKIVYSE